MKNVTRWSPDTCGCVLDFEWDTDDDPASRTHTIKNIIKKCPVHQSLSVGDTWDAVQDENKRKNRVLKAIFDNVSSAVEEVVEGGQTVKKLKGNREYKWSFDPDRTLAIDLVNFTLAEKTSIQGIATTQFAGKVRII